MNFIRKRHLFSEKINQELHSLHTLDNWHGLLAIMIDYIIIFSAIISSTHLYWLYPVSFIIIGSRQRALATILHESAHSALAKNKTLNYILGTYFSGFFLLQDYDTYVASHIKKHHAYLGDKNLDPDYKYYLDINLFETPKEISKWCKFPFKYFIYLMNNRMGIITGKTKSAQIGRYYLLILFLSIYYLGYFKYFIIFWFLPLITSFLLIGWILELAEHYPMVHYNSIDIYMTRNRFSHWSEAFFLSIHNENFHLIHHLKPRLPFWNLKKAHQVLMQDEYYRRANAGMGGIFFSSNKNLPFISLFLKSLFSIKKQVSYEN